MSDSKNDQDVQDPDYATPGPSDEAHQKIFEETARSNVARKITAIIENEFSKEIETKEKEIVKIEERLHKAMKTLHFLRYVIITDFYTRKQCQLVQSAGETKQGRIHPAIKQVIGKTPKTTENLFDTLENSGIPSTSRENLFHPEIASTDNETINREIEKRLGNFDEIPEKNLLSQNKCTNGKRTANDGNFGELTDDERPRKIPRYVPPKSGIPEPQVPSRGARHKVRKRIVVGNISKWIPPDWREDTASHKWTMYVRGSKENADIADFVGKIRFFLHPSYRPNDVVEVTSPPFHLSRRGWGEFPLRVQLHFKNPLNKPMDIIHYLKLDRTYTGLQTLGSETVVDVWIKTSPESSSIFDEKDEKMENSKNNQSLINLTAPIKEEPSDFENTTENSSQKISINETIKNEPDVHEIPSHILLEHDYANISDKNWPNFIENENNVTISHSPEGEKNNEESSQKKIAKKSSNDSVKNFELESTEIQTSRIFNGNSGIAREFTTISDNGEPEITIEACDSSIPEVESVGISNIRQDVKTMASNLDNSSSKLQPLRIAIPAAFEALRRSTKITQKTNKQILVLKDGKLIPVNSINLPNNGKPDVGPVATIVSGVSSVNMQKSGTSLLKRSTIGNSTKMLFKLNPTNSLMLNDSSNIPALKIVEPTTINTQRLYLVEKKLPHRTTVGILSKSKNKFKEPPEHWLDNYKLVTKPKITLGKDKVRATSKRENYEEILRSIDDAKITDVSALVRFIIRRFPLITERATDPEYRNLHPYALSSEKEFLDSNVGKQRALEWYRAKRVKSFLKKKGIPDDLQWTIKEIMIWSRLHGHTPIRSLPNVVSRSRLTGDKTSEKNLPIDSSETNPCTFTEPTELLQFLRTSKECKITGDIGKKHEDEMEIIDVENIDNKDDKRKNVNESGERRTIISLGIPEKIVALQSYVCDTARQIGIKLVSEEIVPGVTHCAPARMMVRAVQCLLEDLLRSSLAKAWERSSDGGCPDTITLEDVRGAILNREEFDVFTNEGLGSHQCPDD